MSALDVLRQIKQARRQQTGVAKIVEWGNADYINSIGGIENLTRKDLRNHLEVFIIHAFLLVRSKFFNSIIKGKRFGHHWHKTRIN